MILIKAIALTNGGHAIVDADRYEELNQHKWKMNRDGYVYRVRPFRAPGRSRVILMHQVVNQTPDGFETDHKNGVRHFNWAANLRTVTYSQNCQHRRKRNRPATSKFKGVSFRARDCNWEANIMAGGVKHRLGSFDSEIQAAIAYNRAARELHGEFAVLNDVDESLYDPAARLLKTKPIFPGVSYEKRQAFHLKPWRAYVQRRYIGNFKDAESAAKARDHFIREHGLDLPLTFPPC